MTGLWQWWTRICGERPWRAFALLWAAIMLLFIVVGAIGFRHESWPNPPPPPTAIDYQAAISQRGFYGNIDYKLDPAVIPVYDPWSVPLGVNGQVPLVPNPQTGEPWFIWQRWTAAGGYGWPVRWLEWVSDFSWDVTDPTQEHRPAERYFNDSKSFNIGSEAEIDLRSVGDAGASLHRIEFDLATFALFVIGFEVVGAIIVWVFWWAARRRRKRFDRGACLACGHLLGPEPKPKRCPECGMEVQIMTDDVRRSELGWAFVVIFLLLLVPWIIANFVSGQAYPRDDPATFAARLAEAEAQAAAENRQRWVAFTLSAGSRGFPVEAHTFSRQQSFLVLPGQRAQAAIPPGLHAGFHRIDKWMWVDIDAATGTVTHITVHWPFIVAQLPLLQGLAFALAAGIVLVVFVGRSVARRRTRA